MFRNYIKTAWRSLLKGKGYSFINIFGLSAGMAVAVLISLWISDELNFDKYHTNYDRIAQVMQNNTYNGKVSTGMGTPIPLASELRKTYGNDFKHVVLSSWSMNTLIAAGDKKFIKQGNYMEAEAPEMLSLRMLRGSRTGLKDPSSVLLSQTMATSLFGDTDPTNKTVTLNGDLDLKVTGVYEDLPLNSSLNVVSFIAPFYDLTNWTTGQENNWGNSSFQIFVQLADNADAGMVSAKIKNVKLNNVSAGEGKTKPEIFLQPMSKWHLYAKFENGVNAGGSIQYVWMFSIIGLAVLLLACINFMNLSTARSEKRAKEVGIRKAIGSLRHQLIKQFFVESLLVSVLAFPIALLIVQLTLPFFNDVSGKQMSVPWGSPILWLAGIGFSAITGLIAGSYPALYLSSFDPVKVLKGTFRAGRFADLPRRVLVVLQFSVSVILIIGTIIVFRQVQFAKSRPIGYSREGLVNMIMQTTNFHDHFDAMRSDLIESGAIVEMAESQSPAYEVDNYGSGFTWTGKDPNMTESFKTIGITPEYGKTLGWQFKDGRDFSKQRRTDSTGMVINEAAVKYMGLKNPVGETIKWGDKAFTVIGVIQDMIMESPYESVNPTIFYINSEIGGILNLKINPDISATAALAKIEAICKSYSPGEAFYYKFVEEEYAHKFDAEERVGKLVSFFSVLAILISCLGLFGMASFMAEQRTKEIGVRKVLGASVFNLWRMLSKDFVLLVLLSCLIAVPIANYFLQHWLEKYTYRTEISWWIFLIAAAGAILITLLTVSYQAITTALTNPVKSLRTE